MSWFFDPLTPMSYDVIVADPPWAFETWSAAGAKKSASRHYATMTNADVGKLTVRDLAQKDCILLMWATAPMLPTALDCMKQWGFVYKSNMIWRKTTESGKVRMGTGYWVRTMHEQVLIGSIGKPGKFSAFPSIFDGIAREHSRKPDEFYALVEKHTSGVRRCDLFSRESRPGWEGWGAECTKFDKEIAA